ncbi:MAG: hypothetical protein Q8S56_00485, partial [Polaromonas sp.]|nr:hypothetical protein [Polaromonas sp.]
DAPFGGRARTHLRSGRYSSCLIRFAGVRRPDAGKNIERKEMNDSRYWLVALLCVFLLKYCS